MITSDSCLTQKEEKALTALLEALIGKQENPCANRIQKSKIFLPTKHGLQKFNGSSSLQEIQLVLLLL